MLKSIFLVAFLLGGVWARLDLTPNDPDHGIPESSGLNDDPAAEAPFECNSTETSFHADSKECHSYYICFNGTASHHTCPMDMAYNYKMRMCVSDLYTPGCRPPVHCRHNGLVQDPKNCTMYYFCSHGHPHHMKCAEGTRFDPVSMICSPDVPCLTRIKYIYLTKSKANDEMLILTVGQ